MKKQLTYDQLLVKAEDYCAQSEHCVADVMEKLYAWGCSDKSARERIAEHLIDNNFINHDRYCHAYTHDKMLYQGWGKQKIQMMLRLKHLPEDNIEQALADIDDQTYEDVLRKVIDTKLSFFKIDDNAEIRLLRFLTQRGFEYDRAIRSIEAALKEKRQR